MNVPNWVPRVPGFLQEGHTALMFACARGHEDVVLELLSASASAEMLDKARLSDQVGDESG